MRFLVWFSCGAASAVASQLAIEKYGHDPVRLVYCDVSASEHPDNRRFMADVERWLSHPVEIIRSARYSDIDDVFERTRYMAGVAGARCTAELKKKPRFAYQHPDDVHIFGLLADEQKRIENMVRANPELHFDWILRDGNVSKMDCYQRLGAAGIALPAMYLLGFSHNNCIGCVKAQSPAYWLLVKKHFPEVFARRAKQSRDIGVRLAKLSGKRIFIDEIPDDATEEIQEDLSCGPECGFGQQEAFQNLGSALEKKGNGGRYALPGTRMSRIRFTMDASRWTKVEQYAKDTNRSTTELICEALDQIMARYPVKRNGHKLDGIDIDDLARRVAEHLKTGVSSHSE